MYDYNIKFKELIGSEKQIVWAKDIISKFFSDAEKFEKKLANDTQLSVYDIIAEMPTVEKYYLVQTDINSIPFTKTRHIIARILKLHYICDCLSSKDSAKWIIDNRYLRADCPTTAIQCFIEQLTNATPIPYDSLYYNIYKLRDGSWVVAHLNHSSKQYEAPENNGDSPVYSSSTLEDLRAHSYPTKEEAELRLSALRQHRKNEYEKNQ